MRTLVFWSLVFGTGVTISTLSSLRAAQILALAGLVFAATALPLFVGIRRPLHHPSVIALGLVSLFTIPKALWIASNGTALRQVTFNVLRGHATISLVWGLLALAAGYLGYSLGVMFTHKPFRLPRWAIFSRPSRPSWARIRPMLLSLVVITSVALVLFVAATGFDFSPKKRFADVEGGSGARIGTIAYLWFRVALLSRIGVVTAMFWRYVAASNGNLRRARQLGWLAMGNGVVAVLTPYLADNRAGVMLVLLDVVVLTGALGSNRRRWIPIIGGGALGLAVSSSLLSARLGSSSGASTIESFVLSRDLADFSKVGVIIESGYSTTGNSLWHWLLTPLPPSYWPVRNEWVNAPDEVWTFAYGEPSRNGVPPSLPGELFSSFSWLGVFIGMFLFGVLVKKVYATGQRQLKLQSAGAVVFLVFLVRLNIFGLSSDLGTGVVKGLLEAIPLAFVLALGERRGTATR